LKDEYFYSAAEFNEYFIQILHQLNLNLDLVSVRENISEFNKFIKKDKKSVLGAYAKKVNEYFSATYLGFYQPNIEDFSDYRIHQILQLDTFLGKNISLGIDFSHKYNATPYHQVDKTDISSMISLKYKLK